MPKPRPNREKKLENLILNHSMIVAGLFEESFEEIAERLTQDMNPTVPAADAISSAIAGSKASPAAVPPVDLRIRMEIGEIFSEIRGDIESEWPKNPKVFRDYVSKAAFDKGIKIAESYDLRLPRLTEELTDETLASYVFLLKGGDREVTKMFRELSVWQKKLPRPPWGPPDSTRR